MLLRLARWLMPSVRPLRVPTALATESGSLLATESGRILVLE